MNRELLEQVYEILIRCSPSRHQLDNYNAIIATVDNELYAKPAPEPVGAVVESSGTLATVSASGYGGINIPVGTKLYANPPKREPLSNDRIYKLWSQLGAIEGGPVDFARAIEKAHGIS